MQRLPKPVRQLTAIVLFVGAVAGLGTLIVNPLMTHLADVQERIANERVLIDGPYAVAWMDYTFYLGDQKSHCGVDSFQLVRRPAGWRIFAITDTRRRENCPDLPRK
jgi:hypothetical protein